MKEEMCQVDREHSRLRVLRGQSGTQPVDIRVYEQDGEISCFHNKLNICKFESTTV